MTLSVMFCDDHDDDDSSCCEQVKKSQIFRKLFFFPCDFTRKTEPILHKL